MSQSSSCGRGERTSVDSTGCPGTSAQILILRAEKAKLIGYANFAEVSCASKMATLPRALELIEELRVASYDAAARDLEEVRAFAKENGADYELMHWDTGYWAERLREKK